MISARLVPIVLGAGSVAALALASAIEFTPRLVWNASASARIGLYRIETRAPQLGDLMLVSPTAGLERFLTERAYLPPKMPLLKRVAALPGARICRTEAAIIIDGVHVADALLIDSLGRKMPVWSGCFLLRKHEIFLLNATEKSLDGRYFGATSGSQIIGIARPVWLKADSPK